MNQAERIREYCVNLVQQNAGRNCGIIAIRNGDVHRGLGLDQAHPAVSSVLGSETFEEQANVCRINVLGAVNGANAIFVFQFQA